ncbi:MAG: hypothetical protein KJZ80_06690 [Hyphomicrobiaceae bacterium]|nr:hypothetical protein [Hyphomicrobiaceae bacterium]
MMKTLAIATAAIALGGTALLATAPANAATTAKSAGVIVEARLGGPAHIQRHRRTSRVHAAGVSRNRVLVPYFLEKAKAQRQAISNWSQKVSRMYGSQYASWARAQGKSTSCSRSIGTVSCRVSAVPSTPYRRFGMLN